MFDRDTADPIELIRQGLALLGAEERSTWSGAARSERLVELLAVAERAQAEVIRCAAAWDAVDAWAVDAACSAPAWLSERCAVSRPVASSLTRQARLVQKHDATAAALASGTITAAHLAALAAAAHRREHLYAEHERMLLEAARSLGPEDFQIVTKRWRMLADDVLAREDAADAFERRAFHISETTGGAILGGFLDSEAAGIVMRVLDGLQPPDATNGIEHPRGLAQCRADALVQLCHGDGKIAPSAAVDVIVDYDTLAKRPTALPLQRQRSDLSGLGPVARVVAERLACDGALGRIIMRGRSEVLDYGRRARVVPMPLRRIIVARDEHCQFPGCRAPASWCDVHHLTHWIQGGDTNESNLILLCRRHHVGCHEGGWKLARGPDSTITVRRPGSDLVLAA